MAELLFAEAAAAALDRLAEDPSRRELYERVNDGLDWLEDEPGDQRVRRHRFMDPPLWAFTVFGSGEEWAILWQDDPAGPNRIIVEFLGASDFTTF